MIYTEVNLDDFRNAFFNMGRGDQFSPNALKALYHYLEESAQETETPIELDVIAICRDFSEWSCKEDLLGAYSYIDSIEKMEEYTIVIPFAYADNTTGYIIQNF